jgi:hypothetical protein
MADENAPTTPGSVDPGVRTCLRIYDDYRTPVNPIPEFEKIQGRWAFSVRSSEGKAGGLGGCGVGRLTQAVSWLAVPEMLPQESHNRSGAPA